MQLVPAGIGCICRVLMKTASLWRNFYFRLLGVRIRGYVWLRHVEIAREHNRIELHKACALDRGVVLLCSGQPTNHPKIVVGAQTYINRFTMLDASEKIEIGANCMIGPYCYITDHDHGMQKDRPVRDQDLVSAPVRIGNDVWIGAGAVILKGVQIGEGAVIGAGSVITRDIPAFSKAAGVPARQIGMRL